jgi:hypothetical protein
MRWLAKPEPENADTRLRVGFLLFPRCIDGEWRWLERAAWTQRFRWEHHPECGHLAYWDDVAWALLPQDRR